jgi:hypothetical protein
MAVALGVTAMMSEEEMARRPNLSTG